MKNLGLLGLLVFMVGAPSFAANWYVRPTDGGTRWSVEVPTGQCNGHADVAYPGSGTNQACAFKDARYLWAEGGANTSGSAPSWGWVIGPGDTVLIHGFNRVGYDGPNVADSHGLAIAGDPYTSVPPVPSGTSVNPIVIAGDSVSTSGLFGGYAASYLFDLRGTSYVTIRDLDLTDHASCARIGQGTQCSGNYPLDDYGLNGIITGNTTHDVTLSNVAIHGFAGAAIIGPIGGSFTVNNVRMTANASANWNFDDGSNTPMGTGAIVHANGLIIEWAGCTEEYPIVHSHTARQCYDENHGGYGDGVGTPDTSNLSFDIQNSIFRYNVQDGFDTLHVVGGTESIHNSQSYGNAGQQWKMGKMSSVSFTNNLTVHDCNRMLSSFPDISAGFNTGMGPLCRAGGDGIALIATQGSTYVLENNTYVGYGSTTIDMPCDRNSAACSVSDSPITFRNNLLIGYPNPTDSGRLPGDFYYDSTAIPHPFAANDHNIWFNFRNGTIAGSTNADPLFVGEPSVSATFVESSLDNFNFHLTSGSPAIGAGATIAGLTTDFAGVSRPSPPSIGAYEYAAGSPSVTGNTNMELDTDWLQPGNAGNDTAHPCSTPGTFTFTPGSPGTWYIQGACQYNNGYWYRTLGTSFNAINNIEYALDVTLPTSGDVTASQAIEFETQQNVGSNIYNCGVQDDVIGTHLWRVFDYTSATWTPTTIPATTFTPGSYHTFDIVCHRNPGNTITFVSLTIDGTLHPIGITKSAFALVDHDYINAGFQGDSNGLNPPTPYTIKTKNMNTTLSTTADSFTITPSSSTISVGGTQGYTCTTNLGAACPSPTYTSSASTSIVTIAGSVATGRGVGTATIVGHVSGLPDVSVSLNVIAPAPPPSNGPSGNGTISGNTVIVSGNVNWLKVAPEGGKWVVPTAKVQPTANMMMRFGSAPSWLYLPIPAAGSIVMASMMYFGGRPSTKINELDVQVTSVASQPQ